MFNAKHDNEYRLLRCGCIIQLSLCSATILNELLVKPLNTGLAFQLNFVAAFDEPLEKN